MTLSVTFELWSLLGLARYGAARRGELSRPVSLDFGVIQVDLHYSQLLDNLSRALITDLSELNQ